MSIFEFRAENRQGNIVFGQVEADDATSAEKILVTQGLSVLILEETKMGIMSKNLIFRRRVPMRDLIIFTRQLSTLISADVPVVRALHGLIDQTSNVYLAEIITDLSDEVEGGTNLSTALESFPHVFNLFFRSVIRSGETSGKLDEVLEYLADQSEREYDLKSRFFGAMIYPIFVIFALIVVAILTIMFVLPNLTDILKETQNELPAATKILIGISDFFLGYWWSIMLLFLLGYALFYFYRKSELGEKQIDRMKIHIPVFGKLLEKVYLVRFTMSLQTLIRGGVTVSESLRTVANVTENRWYHDAILDTAKNIEDGNRLAESLRSTDVFPPLLYHMVDVGETSGKLDKILDKISRFYKRELDNGINTLMTLLEPVIIVILGIGVAFLLLAVVLPMYNLASQL
jgi:type IV pilus assembly protein PilC